MHNGLKEGEAEAALSLAKGDFDKALEMLAEVGPLYCCWHRWGPQTKNSPRWPRWWMLGRKGLTLCSPLLVGQCPNIPVRLPCRRGRRRCSGGTATGSGPPGPPPPRRLLRTLRRPPPSRRSRHAGAPGVHAWRKCRCSCAGMWCGPCCIQRKCNCIALHKALSLAPHGCMALPCRRGSGNWNRRCSGYWTTLLMPTAWAAWCRAG